MPKFHELEKIRDVVCNIRRPFSIKDKRLNIFGKNESISINELPANDVLFLGEYHYKHYNCGKYVNLKRLIEQFDYVFFENDRISTITDYIDKYNATDETENHVKFNKFKKKGNEFKKPYYAHMGPLDYIKKFEGNEKFVSIEPRANFLDFCIGEFNNSTQVPYKAKDIYINLEDLKKVRDDSYVFLAHIELYVFIKAFYDGLVIKFFTKKGYKGTELENLKNILNLIKRSKSTVDIYEIHKISYNNYLVKGPNKNFLMNNETLKNKSDHDFVLNILLDNELDNMVLEINTIMELYREEYINKRILVVTGAAHTKHLMDYYLYLYNKDAIVLIKTIDLDNFLIRNGYMTSEYRKKEIIEKRRGSIMPMTTPPNFKTMGDDFVTKVNYSFWDSKYKLI